MILTQPEQGAAEQEAPYFGTSVIEYEAVPVRMHAAPRVGRLKLVRAVEQSKRVLIIWKMRRHPIENHPNPRLMKTVDQTHELLRCAVPAGRRKVTRRLISPRPEKRVLHDGQKLHMRETHLLHIRDELIAQLVV